ncbi:RNA polymerase sigma factor [Micromonospora sp. R77]|uniref:RNA polymerase sigma factor n=1 Tax=Micromonospora sp. R77 TaxID=2925836 RepID=UPI001F604605|nr:RNA polymerase sigma factor [Micromonospora sp. R77]MCI4064911.1 RNA polymerase sigma factor [Micromonospora sp. R77]
MQQAHPQPDPAALGPPPLHHSEPSDVELIRASVTVPERFAPLFDRHSAAVHRYLARRIGPPADDLLGETFLVAFRRRGDYRSTGVGVRPWLFGIATNLLRHHVRQEERRYRALARIAATEVPPAPVDDAVERIDACALRRDLAAALATLHRGDRDVLLLTAWGDLSYEEIAAVLDIPVGTVRSRLHRARRLTRLALDPALITEESS